jgi:hypothetical protein
MARSGGWTPRGVIPAVRPPFRTDFSIGRMSPAVVRPPLLKLPPHEIERLRQAITASGLDREAGVSAAPLAAE